MNQNKKRNDKKNDKNKANSGKTKSIEILEII